ncbi:MAG: hypothetical protein PHY47_14490 [Lachnospiraceae bacterium]|nr:hypothetical protein [Lachnospiraceae bacterium]
MNTMNVNCVSRIYENYTKRYGKDEQVKNTESFNNRVAGLETKKTEVVSKEDMTMEQYKQYIYNQISQIPINPTRLNESISLQISDAGFEAMKNDPEYEEWVLNDLRVGWSQPDQWAGVCEGAFSTIYYGSTKEECHAEMWSKGYKNGNGGKLFDEESKNSFWKKRAEREKMLKEQYEMQMDKKHQAKKVQQELINQKIVNADLLKEAGFMDKNTQNINRAFEAYETSVLTEELK